jgi:hypothetical protein
MRRWVVVAAVAIVASACGGGDAIAPRAAAELDAAYTDLLQTVDAGDRAGARRSLRSLTDTVEDWAASGAIDAERADQIRRAAALVLADLRLLPAPAEPDTETVSPDPSPVDHVAEDPQSDEGHGGGNESDGDDEGIGGGGPGQGGGPPPHAGGPGGRPK